METLRKQYEKEIELIATTSRRLGELSYVASHGGNLSYKVSSKHVLITPTKVVKRLMQPDDIVIVSMTGDIISALNDRKPTGETPMHLLILELRPDLNGIVHAHPPVLTGFSMVDTDVLEKPLLPEPVLEIGPLVQIPYAEPISEELANQFASRIHLSNGWLMRNHGVTIGSSENVDRALEFMEMAEAMATSVAVASALGPLTFISSEEVQKMERTLAARSMPRPGDPRRIKSLTELYP